MEHSPSPDELAWSRPGQLNTQSPETGAGGISSVEGPNSMFSPSQHHQGVLRSAAQAILQSARGVKQNIVDLAASLAQPFQRADSDGSNEPPSEDDGGVSEISDTSESSDNDDLRLGESSAMSGEPSHKRFNAGEILAKEHPAFALAKRMNPRKRIPSYKHLFPTPEVMAKVVPIEDHGLIGNCYTTAMVSTDASICWYCYPNHDSPSLFHSLLDAKEGGCFTIHAGREIDMKHHRPGVHVTTKQLYHPETNVLVTRFFTDSGVGHVTDYLPCGDSAVQQFGARHWLVREIECVRGKMYFEVNCRPAFNYGRSPHVVKMLPYGALFESDNLTMLITSSKQRIWKHSHTGGGVRTKVTLEEGQRVVFVFREWRKDEEERKWNAALEEEALLQRQRAYLADQLAKLDLTEEITPLGKYTTLSTIGEQPHQALSQTEKTWSPLDTQSSIASSSITAASPPMNPHRGLHIQRVHIPPPSGKVEQSPIAQDLQTTPPADKIFGVHTIRPVSSRITDKLRKETIEYWRDWLSKCEYQGRWREMVRRSALLLKMLTFRPTGAIISAPTMCLPSEIGKAGPDSRYVNLRDASTAASAFLRLGFRNEAAAWMSWLAARCQETQGKDGSLRMIWTIHGETPLPPVLLEHIPGYCNSGPVHIGNPAAKCFSLHAYGTLLIAIHLANTHAEPLSYEFWIYTRKLVNYVAEHWREPDEGLWTDAAVSVHQHDDTKDGEKTAPASSSSSSDSSSSSSPTLDSSPKHHFTVSKLMCWVALDRGIKLAHERSFPAPFNTWKEQRDEICSEIMKEGYDKKMATFVQTYGSEYLDAALLLMPVTGFVAPTDPMFLLTLDRIMRSVTLDGLSSNSLIHRSNAHNTNSNAPQITTSVATFWCIEACTRAGLAEPKYVGKARFLMESMFGFANHLGFLSECIGLRGNFLGNSPHCATHVALIRAVMSLDVSLARSKPEELVAAMMSDIPSKNSSAPTH